MWSELFLSFYFINHVYLYLCVYSHACSGPTTPMWQSENNFWKYNPPSIMQDLS